MFLSKKYCFANEPEARANLSGLLSQGSAADNQLFDRVLSTIFSVRRELFEVVRRGASSKERSAQAGLPDICITATEDYVIPAFSAQDIGCRMEIRQYTSNEVPTGLPRIHAYVLITIGNSELVIDIDADPFYNENVGVVIAPATSGLYSLGSPVHRRWVSASGRIDRFECYTRESRTYLTGEGISYLTMRNYFFESDANLCPIVLSPFSTAYFSYSAGWIGSLRRDWIKLILVSHSRENNLLLWNLTFDALSFVEIRWTQVKSLRLAFLDKTEVVIPLDTNGYPLESEIVQYIKKNTRSQDIMKYTFDSSPPSRIRLPSPFEGDGILSEE
jgi:hypothetical protein